MGKIDIYDSLEKELIERKYKIKRIYKGQYYQLYAQMFCMQEMGYEVNKITIYSLSDNKKYNLKLPQVEDINEFENVIYKMRNFNILDAKVIINKNKCNNCIYRELCCR